MSIDSTISRRSFVATVSGTLAHVATGRGYAQGALRTDSQFVEAKTTYGRVRGAQGEGLVTFKGVPYAGSVSGQGRFKAAPALQPWKDVRDALELGAPSPQPGRTAARGGEPAAAEDCLVLNVWTPAADGKRRPVMFYSHGGGFTTGSGGSAYQDGGSLAKTWDVVVVATNHRLGLMGYLYLGDLGGEEYATSGNQGLEDIRDGLRWVHENIANFGGNPDNVMIFGESGGGGKTSCLYAMPTAAPYFNKASIESGPGIRIFPKAAAAETTLMVLKQLGIEKADWRKILDVPLNTLIDVQAKAQGGPLWQTGGRLGMISNPAPGGFGPVVDGKIMPSNPFEPGAPAISKNKPLIAGYNHDEMNFFFAQSRSTDIYLMNDAQLTERLTKDLGATKGAEVEKAYRASRPGITPGELYVAIATARFAGVGERVIAEKKVAQGGAPAFHYIFTHASDRLIPGTQTKMGAAHAAEIAYKFNNVARRNGPPAGGARPLQAGAAGAPQGAGGAPPQGAPGGAPPQGAPGGAPPQGMQPMGAPPPGPSASDVQAALNMSEFWATFARTGQPSAKGQPAWPAYNTKTRATMLIDAACKVVNDPDPLEREVWDRVEKA